MAKKSTELGNGYLELGHESEISDLLAAIGPDGLISVFEEWESQVGAPGKIGEETRFWCEILKNSLNDPNINGDFDDGLGKWTWEQMFGKEVGGQIVNIANSKLKTNQKVLRSGNGADGAIKPENGVYKPVGRKEKNVKKSEEGGQDFFDWDMVFGDLEDGEYEDGDEEIDEDVLKLHVDNGTAAWLKEIAKVPLLSHKQEVGLAVMIAVGQVAEKRLMEEHSQQVLYPDEFDLLDLGDHALKAVKLDTWISIVEDNANKEEKARKEAKGNYKYQGLNESDVVDIIDELGIIGENPTPKKLQALAVRGAAAKEHITRANLRLVVSVAKKYMYSGVPFLDLIQEGNLGLLTAIGKYEFQRGLKFSTFSTWWVRQAVSRSIHDKKRIIRIPVHQSEALGRFYGIVNSFAQNIGRDPSIVEIAKYFLEVEGVAEDKNDSRYKQMLDQKKKWVEEMFLMGQNPTSLESPMGEDGDSELGDFIEDSTIISTYDLASKTNLKELLESFLKKLPEREANILRMRFGLKTGESMTLEQVAGHVGVTRERVRQLEKKALERLRKGSASLVLRDFLNGD